MGGTAQVRKHNAELIREILHGGALWTKDTLARRTGLSPGTCRTILLEMLKQGEVTEEKSGKNSDGRPARYFRYNPDYALMALLGLSYEDGRRFLRFSLADLTGAVRHHEEEILPAITLNTVCSFLKKRLAGRHNVRVLVVSYPGVTHIGEDRDFSPVIAKALELGGYPEDTLIPGMNGGSVVATGFARRAVLSHAEEIVNAVKAGSIRHFFLIGGCDGTRPSRRYYTDFAKLTPPDTVILTLACGKFRLNDLPLGTVAGLPRILDVGQCNDAYSAIRIALGLAEAFDCSVNELPLSIILCWFEQKAVCVLMALLALGIRGIRLGPTLPAFLSPGVAAVLQEKYDLRPITTPEADLAACLGRH